jgi:hypothetical protein
MNKIKSLRHLMPLKLLIPILIISLLAVVSFAASVSISSTTYQAVQGVIYNVVGGFTVADNGFQVTDTAATPTTLPATWSDGGIVTTSTTVGNWQYSLTVTIPATSVALPSTSYTVTVQWDQSGAGYSPLGSFTFTTPATMPLTAQTMTFIIDTGLTTFSGPVGLLITIA